MGHADAANGLSRSDGRASHGSMTLPARRVAANLNAPARWSYSDAIDTSCSVVAVHPSALRTRLAAACAGGDDGGRRQEANP
jgi:hypothetical protein